MTTLTKRSFLQASAAAGATMFMPAIARAQATVLRWGEMLPATHPQVQMVGRIARQVKKLRREGSPQACESRGRHGPVACLRSGQSRKITRL